MTRALSILVLLACAGRLWIAPLPSSFWLDETVTAFVVQHPGDASFAVAPQVPESVYYALPRAAVALFGSSEAVYRLPSVLAMIAALFLIARIAARLIHPEAGWFAVCACFALRGIDYYAVDARPYALGIATALAGVYFLMLWMDGARWLDGFAFVIFAGLLWRVHLLYWPFYFVFAGYATLRLVRGETPLRVRSVAACGGVIALTLIPVAMKALTLAKGAQAHVIGSMPTVPVLAHELHWNIVLLCGVGAWVVSRAFRLQRPRPGFTVSGGSLIAAFWLCQPLGLFFYSHFAGNAVFLPRYVSLLLPGAALAATAAAAYFLPPDCLRYAALVVAASALIAQGHWNVVWPTHDHSDWRAAASEERLLAVDDETPVICPSPFVEARDNLARGFLYAHLAYYPVRGDVQLFPFAGAQGEERFGETFLQRDLGNLRRFLIYGQAPAVSHWRAWFAGRPELSLWRSDLESFGDVGVAVFYSHDPSDRRRNTSSPR